MKKTLLLGAIASLFFVSCSKNEMVESIEPSCDFVAQLADVSRTELDGTAVIWNAEDELTIFTKTEHNRHYKVKTLTEDGRTATFGFVNYTGTSNGTISANYAIYPYDAQATISGDVISTVIASEQQYNAEKIDLSCALMAAKSESNSFAFVNAGALMRFNVSKSELIPDSYTLNSIKLSSAANNIAGDVTIDLSAESRAVVASTGTKEISLTAINQEITTEAKAFYVALPAVSFADKDLTVTFTFADGEKSFALPAFDLLQGSIKTIAYQINDADDFTGTTPDSGEDFEGETPGEETYPANNEIWYTAIAIVDITIEEEEYLNFGTKLVSHEYDSSTRKGVIKCESDILHIASAFTSNDNLISINIPDCVNNFGPGVLLECKNLKTIISKWSSEDRRCLIQDNYLKAFAPAGLTEYTLPNGIENIANSVFRNCSDLTKITIPESVTTIYDYAFSGCSSLESITIPNSVSIINNTTFSGCTALKDVIIGSGVTTIGNRAFNECSSLKNINIPDNVTTIDPTAFLNSGLTSINGKYASTDKRCWIVDGCVQLLASAGLTEYTIPDSATSMDDFAFSFAVNLTSITIPDSVTIHTNYNTSSVYNPFGGCRSLQMFNGKYASASKQYLLFNDVLLAVAPCSELTEFIVPAGVVYVANNAFVIDNSLESITIPGSVKVLNSIKSCTNLKSLYINSTTPPAIGYIQLPENCIAYVPREAVDTYKSARGWSLNEAKIQPYDF